jgi:hypothetical protein
MPNIMCTKVLWRAIGGRGPLLPRPARRTGDAKLGDWSLQELPTPFGHVVVGLEETTYLTVVFRLNMLPAVILDLAASARVALTDIGIERETVDRETRSILADPRFAKNDNRSLLGSVNDVVWHVSGEIEDERRITTDVLHRAQVRLNDMPHAKRDPAFPNQAVRRLFGLSSERRRR